MDAIGYPENWATLEHENVYYILTNLISQTLLEATHEALMVLEWS